MRPTIKPLPKQHIAYQKLQDKGTKYIIFGGGAGGGKELSVKTQVLTKQGWKLAGEVIPEDKLVSADGTFTDILGIYPQGKKRLWRFIFDDGASCLAGQDHQWLVYGSKHGERDGWRVRTTKELLKLKENFSIPLISSSPGTEKSNYDPYILGYIIANGTLTGSNPTIYTTDKEVVRYLEVAGWRSHQYKPNVHQVHLSLSEEMRKIFLELPKFSKQDKHIPEKLLNLAPEERLALLQGLMDGDGTIGKDNACSYSTVVENLANNVVYLVRSLGGKASLEFKKPRKGLGRKESEEIDVRVSPCGRFIPFRLERKVKRVKKPVYDKRYIRDIVEVEKDEAVCFAVDHPSKLFVIEDFIVTHNTWLGCEWLLTSCYFYPDSKWFIGRKELKRLLQSSYETWKKVCKWHKIPETDWKRDSQYNFVEFKNGSRIDLLDLNEQPSDPEYERFGSLEYTGGWIEEAGEIRYKAFDVLKSRIGRQKNKEYNLTPKMLITCNPKKNWLKRKIWVPWEKGELDKKYYYIQSLYSDNHYTSDIYGENLAEIADKSTRQRLKEGNWNYDDDEGTLIDQEAIADVWTNPKKGEGTYITADIARFGKDRTVIYIWEGWQVISIYVWSHQDTALTSSKLDALLHKLKIPRSSCAIDEVGVGGGVVDNLPGTKGFVANASAIEIPGGEIKTIVRNGKIVTTTAKDNFRSLKDQCGYLLAERINSRDISIVADIGEDMKEGITEEIEELKDYKPDEEGKKRLVPKDIIKENLGRSPDHLDCLIMRQFLQSTVGTFAEDAFDWELEYNDW